MVRNLVFLYSEFMPYNLTVWRVLNTIPGFQVHVVFWDHKKLTPYQYEGNDLILYKRSKLDRTALARLVQELNPIILFVSGRMDADYLSVARSYRHTIPVVMGSDNQWKGSVKNKLAQAFSFWLYHRFFTHVWVPGERQVAYALNIGFPQDRIIKGLYVADTARFSTITRNIDNAKDILFIGRLEPVKGVLQLVDVVRKLKKKRSFDGQLRIVGEGSLGDQIPAEKWIIRTGFLPQEKIAQVVKSCAVFCLPSIDEPWGVVVHEMAAAGLLLCCSDVVGAGDHFIEMGRNGLVFKTGDWQDLSEKLEELLRWSAHQKLEGEQVSRRLSEQFNPVKVAEDFLFATEQITKDVRHSGWI